MASPPTAPKAVIAVLEDILVPWNTVGHWQWAWKPLGPKLPERHTHSVLRRSIRAWDRRRWHALVGAEPPLDAAMRRAYLLDTLHAIARHRLPDAESNAVVDRFDRPAGEIETYAEVAPAVRRLAAEKIPFGAVSELPSAAAQRALTRTGLGEVTLLAHGDDPPETRLPAKAGFRSAAQRLGVPASRTMFVGALFWSDVRAAARAGMRAVLLDRADRFGGVEARRIAQFGEVVDLPPGPEPSPNSDGDAPGPGPVEDGPDPGDA